MPNRIDEFAISIRDSQGAYIGVILRKDGRRFTVDGTSAQNYAETAPALTRDAAIDAAKALASGSRTVE